MSNDFSALYAQFKTILDTGTEDQAEQFLTEHMQEFPEDLRQKIMLSLFEGGLKEAAAVQNFKEQGMDVLEELEVAKRGLDDKIKIAELQEKI